MKGVKKLAALYWAQLHLREARALCDLAMSLDEHHRDDDVIFGVWTGVVAAYARSFTQNQGISALDAKFSRFALPRDQVLHDRLIEMRNRLHAHKDRLWEEGVAANMGKNESASSVIVTILEDGQTEWEVRRPAFSVAYFADVKALCELQTTRLIQESDGILKNFLESQPVTPGKYDLEKDFP
jgi:hypothetical protein